MEIMKDRQLWTVHIPADPTTGQEAMELVVEATKRTPWTTKSPISGPEGTRAGLFHFSTNVFASGPFERLGTLLPL
jgi:hypothetical protein